MRRSQLVLGVIGMVSAAVVACGSSGDSGGSGSGGSAGAATGGSGGTAATGGSAGGTGASGGTGGGAGGAAATGGIGGGTGGSAGGTGGTGGTGGSGGGTGGSGGGTGGSGGSGGASAIKTVFLIIMENKAWCEVGGVSDAPYINNTLLPASASTLNFKGPNGGNLHPSEPNYIWLEAGDNLGITNDDDPASNHKPTKDHLVSYLDKVGVTWKSYQEDITGTVCPLTGVGDYKPKHNPNVFFDDSTNTNDPNSQYCIDHNRPLTEFETDLANGTTAQFNLVTPNQCHDMHSTCGPTGNEVRDGDDWLKEWIPKITASSKYTDNGAILVTWDEAESTIVNGGTCCILGNCPIGMIVMSPLGKGGGYTNNIAYDHSSTLKSIQEIFHAMPLLRAAGNPATKDLADLFTTFP